MKSSEEERRLRRNARQRAYSARPERRARNAAYCREWARAHPEARALGMRRATLKALYGLTIAQYEERLQLQGGHCALCERAPKKNRLSIDHDPRTGRGGTPVVVRGLLCVRCNSILGGLDDEEWFKRAKAYLGWDTFSA